jgi:ABC-type sulfate/molybdate transport systems ATPase subunit
MLSGSQRTLLKGAPAMAQIILDHVEKAYPGGVKAVDGLSLDIAMVFQNYALYPHMTVEQNLAFGLQLRKTRKAEIARRTGAPAG